MVRAQHGVKVRVAVRVAIRVDVDIKVGSGLVQVLPFYPDPEPASTDSRSDPLLHTSSTDLTVARSVHSVLTSAAPS